MPLIRWIVLAAALAAGSCAPRPESAPEAREKDVVVWRTLGSWSGRGSTQTESFTYESGTLRVRWETRNEASPSSGRFRLVFQSAISGRELAVAADHRGVGRGESYIAETPRSAYMLVDSENLDWSFTVEEGVSATVVNGGTAPRD
jgi:hypothetical protein